MITCTWSDMYSTKPDDPSHPTTVWKNVLWYEECIRFLSLIKCPHKYSDGLRSCNCGVKSSVVFFGVKMVLAKCWLYFGTLSCCSITSWILPKQCVTKYLIHSSTLDSLYLHENLASPLFKCSLEITTHILRAFCWFLTFILLIMHLWKKLYVSIS